MADYLARNHSCMGQVDLDVPPLTMKLSRTSITESPLALTSLALVILRMRHCNPSATGVVPCGRLRPIFGDIVFPLTGSELSVGHPHCFQVRFDSLEAVLVGWIRKYSTSISSMKVMSKYLVSIF